jgi:nitroimidazol reductase NimA-like FMN-containing flavoprotein (pyridoxamine 5'-phosphate oxidase superfamily)
VTQHSDDTSLHLRANSAWDRDGVRDFLRRERIPLRLGIESSGKPLIVTLWFELRDDVLWCVSHRNSLVVRRLQANPACAIDVSTNDIPYRGVRGAGRVSCLPEEGAEVLERLIHRYLGTDDNRLARWLKSRQHEETALRISPEWLTSWDFSRRMSDIQDPPER